MTSQTRSVYGICVDTQIREEPTSDQVETAVETLKLLGDSTRLRVLWVLLHGEHSVNELADHLDVQAAALSQHLAKLRLGRLVTVRREGNRMFYSARDAHVGQLVEQVLFHADHIVTNLDDHLGAQGRTAATNRKAGS